MPRIPSRPRGRALDRHVARGLLALALATPSLAASSVAERESAIVSARTLPNGLEVTAIREATASTVAVQVWYRVGSADERPGERGLAHLFEHLMFGATDRYPRGAYERLHTRHGGRENAYTSPDETVYHSEMPPGHLDEVLAMEASRMRGLVLDEAALAIERDVVTEELRLRTENDPAARAFAAAQAAILGDHPYAVSPTGTREDIAAVTLDACRAFYDRWYRPENAHVVVVGPDDAKRVADRVAVHFGGIRRGRDEPRERVPAVDTVVFPPETVLREDLPPIEVALLGFPLPPEADIDAVALDVLVEVLVGAGVAPFREEHVEQERRAIEAGTEVLRYRRGSAVIFYSIDLPHRRRSTAFRKMHRTLERLSEFAWLTDDAIEAAKLRIRSRLAAERYRPNAVAGRVGESWWGGRRGAAAGFWRGDGWEQVDRERLVALYRGYFVEREPVRLYLRPTKIPWYVRAFGWAVARFVR